MNLHNLLLQSIKWRKKGKKKETNMYVWASEIKIKNKQNKIISKNCLILVKLLSKILYLIVIFDY